MSKILILKEVKARSGCGTTIIVEQVFEKNLNEYGRHLSCLPLPKIAINGKLINLDEENSFIHPGTNKLFKVTREEIVFRTKRKIRHFY
jgi:hypothetical protein